MVQSNVVLGYIKKKEGVFLRVAIIGGGASGLACACVLAKSKNIDVTVFEKNERVGKKLLSTGNGRCNLTNLSAAPNDYFEAADFVSFALEKYPPKSNLAFFETLGLFSKADSEGRVYPLSNQASSVLDALRFECERLGVRFVCSCEVKKARKKGGAFLINDAESFERVVFACGSRSAVKDFGSYSLLSSFGHTVTKTAPALVRLTTDDKAANSLKGIRASASMVLRAGGKKVACSSGELQFAEGSLSGIVSMELSSFVSRLSLAGERDFSVDTDFASSFSFDELFGVLLELSRRSGLKSENLLSGLMPKKLGVCLLKRAGISPESAMNALSQKQLREITAVCKKCSFKITGVGSFSQSQVTVGGIKRGEFDPKTLESKKCRGLYCCGEMLDVDGKCGGYNLQWAFSGARLCAESIIRESEK